MKHKKKNTSIKCTTPLYYHKSTFNLFIANSKVHNAGLGVFTRELIPKDTIIDEYCGDVYEISHSPSRYFFEIEEGLGIDAFNLPRCYMAMINDTYGTNHSYNCEFIVDNRRVFVKALTIIQPDQELFISYGDQYWTTH
jgi:SET domain-containing protein